MELRDLRAFAAVVELGGMTRAARRLHVVQSSVSQAVKRLEAEFGLELLERRSDGVRPTPAGEELLRHGQRLLEGVGRLELEMASYRRQKKGVVSVGMAATLSALMLADLVRTFRDEMPDVTLRVHEGSQKRLVEGVRLGRLDLLLVVLPFDPEGLEVVKTGALELVLVVPPRHPLAGRREVDLAELEGEPWVSFGPATPARRWVEDSCLRAGFRPTITGEVETMGQLKAFVEGGHGIGLLPRGVAASELATGRLAAVRAAPAPTIEHGYAYDGTIEARPAVRLARQIMERELRALARG